MFIAARCAVNRLRLADQCLYSPHRMRRMRPLFAAKDHQVPTYIHELEEWPDFRWDERRLLEPLARVRHRQGRLIGHMQGLGFTLRSEATLQALTQDVLKSSQIEGEKLDSRQVRSSLARRL